MLMALAGAYTSHYLKFIGPNATDPLTATFLVWVMLVVGGSANNKGAILGAFLMWTVWSATEIVTSRLPDDLAIRTAYVRIFLIGLVLQIVLQKFPKEFYPNSGPHRPPGTPEKQPAGATEYSRRRPVDFPPPPVKMNLSQPNKWEFSSTGSKSNALHKQNDACRGRHRARRAGRPGRRGQGRFGRRRDRPDRRTGRGHRRRP